MQSSLENKNTSISLISKGSQPLFQPLKKLKINHNNKVTHKITRYLQHQTEMREQPHGGKLPASGIGIILKVEVMKERNLAKLQI